LVARFTNQNSQFGQILEGLAMEDVGIFYDIRSVVRTFLTVGQFCANSAYFFPDLVCCKKKNLVTVVHTNVNKLAIDIFS
jgi:hypothetical protein